MKDEDRNSKYETNAWLNRDTGLYSKIRTRCCIPTLSQPPAFRPQKRGARVIAFRRTKIRGLKANGWDQNVDGQQKVPGPHLLVSSFEFRHSNFRTRLNHPV
jgi:hypothetical protein